MKLRTSIRAGAKGCSPEAQVYMQKALALENKVSNCLANSNGVFPPYYGNFDDYPMIPPSYIGATYPDRSGWCG